MEEKKTTEPIVFLKPEECTSIEILQAEFEKVFLMEDRGVLKMVVAAIVGNRLFDAPIWLLLVAPPSGGKTELILCVEGLEFVFAVDDLTVNTFASGMKRAGEESSLLHKINNGIITFKDFTSILSKNKEARAEIMKQLRQIYDGDYTKRTGNGADIEWKGKIGALAGCTESIYRFLTEFSDMGDRFIMYNIVQPDRVEQARRALENNGDMREKREHLKACTTYFVNLVIDTIEEHAGDLRVDKSIEEELIHVADFATRARSAVMTDFKSGLVDFVPKAEMPARMIAQLCTFATAFVAINRTNKDLSVTHPAYKGQLTEEEKVLLFKTAFDSIPRSRRDAIYPLVQYSGGVSTAGLATFLELPTDSVKKYLQQVNALGLCTRVKKSGPQGDMWKMKEKWREVMLKIEKLEVYEQELLGEGGDQSDDDTWEMLDKHKSVVEKQAEEESLDPQGLF